MRLDRSLYSNWATFKKNNRVQEILLMVSEYLKTKPHAEAVDLFHDDYKYLFDRWTNKLEDTHFGDPIPLENIELCLSRKNNLKGSTQNK